MLKKMMIHHSPFNLPLLGFDFPTILPLPCVPVAHGAPMRRMACCRHSEDRAEEEGGRLSWWKRLGKIMGKFGPLGAFLEDLWWDSAGKTNHFLVKVSANWWENRQETMVFTLTKLYIYRKSWSLPLKIAGFLKIVPPLLRGRLESSVALGARCVYKGLSWCDHWSFNIIYIY